MKTISIINYKGGVGKTTITANLAVGLAARKRRVLAIDLDPQTNLTYCFIRPEQWDAKYPYQRTLKDWFDEILSDKGPSRLDGLIVANPGGAGPDLICSHLGLLDVEAALTARVMGGAHGPGRCDSPALRRACQETRKAGKCPRKNRPTNPGYAYMKTALAPLANEYDVVLFDCPPSFGALTRCAIFASDSYLVPAKMDYLSTIGIAQLRHRVMEFSKAFELTEPTFLGVLANMVAFYSDSLISTQRAYHGRLTRDDVPIFETMLRESKNAYATGEFVINLAGNTAGDEMHSLVDEFIAKTGV